MRIRFYNALILTMEEGREIFAGELHVKEEYISYVGEELTGTGQEKAIFDREIDCKGNLLMPGFKNAHSHAPMAGFRSFADDMPLQEWLHTKIFPMEAKLTGEDMYHLTMLAVLEYLTSGITAVFDMYLSPIDVSRACVDTGMRCVQVSAMSDFGSSPEEQEELYLALNEMHPLISCCIGFHAEYTNSRKNLEKVAALSQKYKAPVYTHNAETLLEVEECRMRYGITPTQLFDLLGMFEYGGGGFHCVHMSQADLDIFSTKKLNVVTNPASNLKLASGIAPIQWFLKAGIPVSIGTDGAASNNCLDMFREMFLVSALSKFRETDAAVTSAGEVLKMATVNGAAAMSLKDASVLGKGKLADLILIDLNQPNMQPFDMKLKSRIIKNLVYSGSKQNVILTMIHGVIRYESGQFYIGTSPREIYQKANEIIDRIR